jgi:hypothetical protein
MSEAASNTTGTRGDNLGSIDEIVIDKVADRAIHVGLSFGGFLAWARDSARCRGRL